LKEKALQTMVDPFTGKRWTAAEMFRSSAHRMVENAFWSADRGDWATAQLMLGFTADDLAWCAAHEVYAEEISEIAHPED
jgi:hypothetical protein